MKEALIQAKALNSSIHEVSPWIFRGRRLRTAASGEGPEPEERGRAS